LSCSQWRGRYFSAAVVRTRIAAILKTSTTAAATLGMFAAGVASTCSMPPPGRRRVRTTEKHVDGSSHYCCHRFWRRICCWLCSSAGRRRMGAGGGLKVESFPSELRFPVCLCSRDASASLTFCFLHACRTPMTTPPLDRYRGYLTCVYTVPPQQ
jgi:hypothetical protein